LISPRTLIDLSWSPFLHEFAKRCRTSAGARRAEAWSFFASAEEARAHMAGISEARKLTAIGRPPSFGGIADVEELLDDVTEGGVLEPLALLAVGETAHGCDRLREHFKDAADDAPRLSALAAKMPVLRAVHEPILRSIDADGNLLDSASPELGRLRKRLSGLKTELESKAQRLLEDKDVSRHLQDRFYTQRDDRYVLPIKAGGQSAVKGIVHGTSQSGGTVFVEPEALVEVNNKKKIAECDVADEERRILRMLADGVREHAGPLRHALEVSTALDTFQAAAALAVELDAVEPDIGAPLKLVQGRHPQLTLSKRGCVPNDIVIGDGQTLIVSGPNAGGKTVVLKTAGMAALMVRAGLHVCAGAGTSVPWYANVESDIGDWQSIESDLSTFSGHIKNVSRMLEEAGPGTLVLIDEIASATEPEQGAALAQALLEAFADKRATVMVSTHYERLKVLAAGDGRMVNASVGFDLERLEPTFRLHLGIPGPSSAIEVADRLGVSRNVLGRARDILGDSRLHVEKLMRDVTLEKQKLEEERGQVAEEKKNAEVARRSAEAVQKQFKEKVQTLHKGAHDEAVAALRDARRELEALKGTVKRRRSGIEVEQLKEKVATLAAEVTSRAPEPAPAPGKPATADTLVVGTRVFVLSLASEGEVVAAPHRNRVEVRVGSLRSHQAISNLHVLGGPPPRKQAGPAKGKGKKWSDAAIQLIKGDEDGRAIVRTADATLDIRGERVDEGIARLDRFLDQSFLQARDVVFVIHGHGTGALRDGIRDYLRSRPEVQNFRPGEPSEGGDGVTVLFLDA
jgi:DNA mismatch repair protein MutS2